MLQVQNTGLSRISNVLIYFTLASRAHRIFSALDINGDGELDVDEFTKVSRQTLLVA